AAPPARRSAATGPAPLGAFLPPLGYEPHDVRLRGLHDSSMSHCPGHRIGVYLSSLAGSVPSRLVSLANRGARGARHRLDAAPTWRLDPHVPLMGLRPAHT